MKNMHKILISFLLLAIISGCEETSDMAVDRVASPVLAVLEEPDTVGNIISIKASFYELDKSGILDQNVSIDSIPVTNLPISVYINESHLLGDYTTDANGTIFFERESNALEGISRLEWVGTHKQIPFRVYQNL